MSFREHQQDSPQCVNCAVLTFSDSRTEQDDESGKILCEKLSGSGHKVVDYTVLKDDSEAIGQKISELLGSDELQVIITNGSTGVSHRDVAVEAISPILEKKLDGFGELFRHLSYQEIGTASILSRAIAGIAQGKVIICLPGSPGAAGLAIDSIILPEIGHMVREAAR